MFLPRAGFRPARIWSGGDPVDSFYNRSVGLATIPGFFPLTPKLGWEAATGFDYRFAGSPWHVSGQLRIGEARASASALIAQNFIVGGVGGAFNSDSPRADQKETHWLADMALGRDVIGSGPDAMQFKFGVRVAELRSVTNATNPRFASFAGATASHVENAPQDNRFLGAGPRIGLDGSVPMGSGWTFDYLGDVAALFGTQKFQRVTSLDNFVTNVPNTALVGVPRVVDAVEKFGTVFNSDIQLGVSYWVSQNMKISASYRLDAYFNVFAALDAQNDATRLQRIDRYTHGPRLAVSAQF
jgi:Legionella pneumophila major outer membrane protein precursor